jgi:zinc protease
MKKINNFRLIIFFILLSVSFVFTSSILKADDGTKEFDVDGLKVILRNTGKDVISARLFITGGTANYPLDKQGVEAFSFDLAIKGGTTSMNKNDFLSAAEKIGTSFGSEASLDFGEMNMTCLKDAWNVSWNMFTDAIMNPAFSNTEFTNKKEQFISSSKQNESNPDSHLNQLSISDAFKGTNYEKNPAGTPESLSKLTLDDLKSYYKDAVCKKRAFLVVVGNVDQNDLTEKVRATLSKLSEGTASKQEGMIKIDDASQKIIDRKIETNYLCGLMSGVKWDSPDIVPMLVAMDIMYDKYFVELRTKRSLSYAPAAYMYGNAITSPFNVIYITTGHPKEAIEVMVNIINDVMKNGFTDEELTNSRNSYITRYFMRLETSASQSLNIGKWKLRGNLKMYDEFGAQVNGVTLQDINKVFRSNAGKLKWTYLGDKTKVSPEDFKQIEKVSW